jgi:4-diphosphocytidyl-2-C-methyl-D-erythritol kinase
MAGGRKGEGKVLGRWRETSPAKINVTLEVMGKRTDGYHDLRMVMQTVSLYDTVTLRKHDPDEDVGGVGGGGDSAVGRIRVATSMPYLPRDEKNLAGKAAIAFFERIGCPAAGWSLHISKQIPVGAGLGGGSANAAAALRLLNKATGANLPTAELEKVAASVGSDVPFCVQGGTRLAEGRGEILSDLPKMPFCYIVICKPPFAVQTAKAFAAYSAREGDAYDFRGFLDALQAADLKSIGKRLFNALDSESNPAFESVALAKKLLERSGALGTSMTGSGSAAFGVFAARREAQLVARDMSVRYPETFVAHPVWPGAS